MDTISSVLANNVSPVATLHTDSAKIYIGPGAGMVAKHESVNHEAKEYVRGDVTTNRVEGFFSLIRRGLHGIYHSVSEKHLHRYISEFEFRYNHSGLEDGDRVAATVRAGEGKRLMYREQAPKAAPMWLARIPQ